MAPRGLGIRSGERLPAVKGKRDHPASPRSLSANWITEVLDLLDPRPAAEGPGCSCPVPCEQRPRLNGTHFSCRWLRSSIPTDLTARSHRPRAVEHRDCPPCGGDGRIITQVRGGGDGGFSIPQLAGVSGLIGLGLAFWDSAELGAGSGRPLLPALSVDGRKVRRPVAGHGCCKAIDNQSQTAANRSHDHLRVSGSQYG